MNTSLTASQAAFSELPTALQVAQNAINQKEVQDMLKTLSKYNLGICMPHMHTDEEDFAILPENMLQVETNCYVTFEKEGISLNDKSVPVSWRWSGNETTGSAKCNTICTPTHLQSGGEGHKVMHSFN